MPEDKKRRTVQFHGIVVVKTPQGLQQAPFELQGEGGQPLDAVDPDYLKYYAENMFNQNPNILSATFFRTELVGAFTRPETPQESKEVKPPKPVDVPFTRSVCSTEGCTNETSGIIVKDGDKQLPLCDECWERFHPGEIAVRTKRGEYEA